MIPNGSPSTDFLDRDPAGHDVPPFSPDAEPYAVPGTAQLTRRRLRAFRDATSRFLAAARATVAGKPGHHPGECGWIGLLIGIPVCFTLVACAGPQPIRYSGIGSASLMQPNQESAAGKVAFGYSARPDWNAYNSVLIDQVAVYRGLDNQFGDMPDKDRLQLASYMRAKFSDVLSRRFRLVSTPDAHTLQVRLTLTGAAGTPLIGKFAHVDMAGNLYNGIQAVRDEPGLQSGWVMYVVEITDASTGKLLEAFETKQYPNAMNPNAAFSSLAAPRIGIGKGSEALVARLR